MVTTPRHLKALPRATPGLLPPQPANQEHPLARARSGGGPSGGGSSGGQSFPGAGRGCSGLHPGLAGKVSGRTGRRSLRWPTRRQAGDRRSSACLWHQPRQQCGGRRGREGSSHPVQEGPETHGAQGTEPCVGTSPWRVRSGRHAGGFAGTAYGSRPGPQGATLATALEGFVTFKQGPYLSMLRGSPQHCTGCSSGRGFSR